MSELVVPIISGVALVAAALVAFFGTRGKTRADAKAALDARIDARVRTELDRVYERLEAVEKDVVRKTSAMARILRAIAAQWRGDPSGPDLDPADIKEIEDTIPPQWIRQNHTT